MSGRYSRLDRRAASRGKHVFVRVWDPRMRLQVGSTLRTCGVDRVSLADEAVAFPFSPKE